VIGFISYPPLVRIRLGPLSISPHGIGIAAGFLLGARLLLPQARRQGIKEDDVYALLTRAAIGAIVGARIAYVINHAGDYTSVWQALEIWKGGISLLGGFAGAIAAAVPAMRKRHISLWRLMDAAAPGMALGVLIGRVGDLIVWDHLGKSTTFFLGYRCPSPSVATAAPCIGRAVHEPALYDLVMVSALLIVLLWLRRTPRYDGFLIGLFFAWYSVERFIEDFFRIDVTHGTGLTGSQWTSVGLVLACLWLLLRLRRTPRWGQWDLRSPAEPSVHTEPSSGHDSGRGRTARNRRAHR